MNAIAADIKMLLKEEKIRNAEKVREQRAARS
jgi:hypothetical protein